jgi:phosphopantothenate synthetase
MMIFDKPNSVDLLEAVNYFLDTKIKSEVPAHLAFKIRIVENVLNIVKREIEQGDELSNEIMVQLQNLIEDDSPTIDALALLIKDEKIDLEDQDLQNILVKLSKNKIAVDNPNYSTYKKLLD